MPGQVDAHGLGGHLVVPDGLEGPAVGGVHQQDDKGDAHGGQQHGDKGGQADGSPAQLELEGVDAHKAFQGVGAVGDGPQLAPLEDRPDHLGKAQGGDGQVVGFQPQHRQADQPGHQGGGQPRGDNGQHHTQQGARRAHGIAQRLREGETDGGVVVLIDHIPGLGGDGEDGVGVSADQHEAGVPQGEQAGKAVEQVHGYGGQGVDGALLQHLQEHGHAVGGLDDLVQNDDKYQHGGHQKQGDKIGLFAGRNHSCLPLPIPCRWSSHRTGRWA